MVSDHRIGDNFDSLSNDAKKNKKAEIDGIFGEELKRIEGLFSESLEKLDPLSDQEQRNHGYEPKTVEEKLIYKMNVMINNIIEHSNFSHANGVDILSE